METLKILGTHPWIHKDQLATVFLPTTRKYTKCCVFYEQTFNKVCFLLLAVTLWNTTFRWLLLIHSDMWSLLIPVVSIAHLCKTKTDNVTRWAIILLRIFRVSFAIFAICLYPLDYYITYMHSFQPVIGSQLCHCAYMYVLYFYVVGCICQPRINEHVIMQFVVTNDDRYNKNTATKTIFCHF